MKVTLEHYDRKIIIEIGRDDLEVSEVMDDIIKPLLLGAGYSIHSLNDILGEEDDTIILP